ncbi:MAG: O-antigen polysaccharide polymerase Wzy [Blautia wexlerae]
MKNNIPKIEYKNKKGYMNNIIQISKGMYYGCYVFWILTVIDVVLYVRHYGYISYYISYSSRIPWYVRQIGYFCADSILYIFVNITRKKDAKVPIMFIYFICIFIFRNGTKSKFYYKFTYNFCICNV